MLNDDHKSCQTIASMFSISQMRFCLCLSVLFALFLKATSTGSNECTRKFYSGQDSFVCECNTNSCQVLPKVELKDLTEQEVIVFRSDRRRYRFKKKVLTKKNYLPDPSESFDAKITVNATEKRQEIIGFGGAFTDATGINILGLEPSLQKRLFYDNFGQSGLEYNIGRVPIGGSDFSTHNYSYDDHEDDFELEKFSLTKEDFEYKIPFIKQAQKLVPNLKLFASIWSPPAWMKTNKALNGLGILIGDPGTFYWKLFAKYHVKFLEEYKKNGVDFWGLTTSNEPTAGLKPRYAFNAIGFSAEMLMDLVKQDLGPALEAAGFGPDRLKLMVHDDNLNSILYYTDAIFSDPEAAKYISGIAYHWYTAGYENLGPVALKYPDKFLISSEACDGFKAPAQGVALGNWSRAENYAESIIEGLNYGSSGWVDWNMALNLEGGPNWVKNFVDAPIIVNHTSNEYYKQPTYYALGHFTKFLPPGSVRVIHSMDATSELKSKLKVTTFLNKELKCLVLIILNKDDHPALIKIDGASDDPLKLKVRPHSITTLISKTDFLKEQTTQ